MFRSLCLILLYVADFDTCESMELQYMAVDSIYESDDQMHAALAENANSLMIFDNSEMPFSHTSEQAAAPELSAAYQADSAAQQITDSMELIRAILSIDDGNQAAPSTSGLTEMMVPPVAADAFDPNTIATHPQSQGVPSDEQTQHESSPVTRSPVVVPLSGDLLVDNGDSRLYYHREAKKEREGKKDGEGTKRGQEGKKGRQVIPTIYGNAFEIDGRKKFHPFSVWVDLALYHGPIEISFELFDLLGKLVEPVFLAETNQRVDIEVHPADVSASVPIDPPELPCFDFYMLCVTIRSANRASKWQVYLKPLCNSAFCLC